MSELCPRPPGTSPQGETCQIGFLVGSLSENDENTNVVYNNYNAIAPLFYELIPSP